MTLNQNQKEQRLTRQTLHILSSRLFGVILVALSIVIIPRVLGPAGIGFYLYWNSIFIVLFMFTDPGSLGILARYLPVLKHDDPEQISPLISKLFALKLALIISMSTGVWFFSLTERYYYLTILAAAGLLSLASLAAYLHYELEKQRVYGSLFYGSTFFRLVFIVGGFLLFRYWGILLCLLAMSGIMLIYLWWSALELIRPSWAALDRPFPEYIKFGLPIHLATCGFIFLNRSLIIQAKLSDLPLATIGVFGIAVNLAITSFYQLAVSIPESVLPALVKARNSNDQIKFRRILDLSWRYANLLGLGLTGLLFAASRPLIVILLGSQFAPAIPYLRLLLLGSALICWEEYFQRILIVFDRNALLAYILGGGATCFWLGWFFINHNGNLFRLIYFYLAILALVTLIFGKSALKLVTIERFFRNTLKIIGAVILSIYISSYLPMTNVLELVVILITYSILFVGFSLLFRVLYWREFINHFRENG